MPLFPKSGEVVTRNGLIVAACELSDGTRLFNLGPDNKGFPSKLAALDFINLTLKEGAEYALD